MATKEHNERKDLSLRKSLCSMRAFAAKCFLISAVLVLLPAPPNIAFGQTNLPYSYFRSYINDVPNKPLVNITLTASNVACLTIEEDLLDSTSPISVSGDGVWLPSLGVIHWGPYFNISVTNVSYRLTGLPGSYTINGGASMDGERFVSPGPTLVNILPIGGSVGAPSKVATPVFSPVSGSAVPTDVTISCATPGAAIYYTLDGSLPARNSTPYSGAIHLAGVSTIRAVAFTNGWIPSAAAVAFYGPPLTAVNAVVRRSFSTTSPQAPVVTFTVTPGANAACIALTENLPQGLAASNVTGGGNYVTTNNTVMWGPFFGTTPQVLTYQALGQPGTYSVQASWSVDGIGGGESAPTNITIAAIGGPITGPPSQVAAPVFMPPSGSARPTNVTISCSTPGARIYYTLNGLLPNQNSTPYSAPVHLTSNATVIAVAFTNGWIPSPAGIAFYGPPASGANAGFGGGGGFGSGGGGGGGGGGAAIGLALTPGTNASCIAVTESLSPRLTATNVSSGGFYNAAANSVVWGPFFGTNALALSFVATGQPGTYPVQITWSVDGASSQAAANIVLTNPPSGEPTLVQEPTPTFSPPVGTNLPIHVSISSSDSQAVIYFTTDGTLPTQNSTPYTTPLTFTVPTTLRAVAFRPNYSPSASALGYYAAAPPGNSLSLTRSISGGGTNQASVTLNAAPQGSVNCYAVTEALTPGLRPSGLAADAVWNASNNIISWGPYFDKQSRALTYQVGGPPGTFPLSAQGSVDGYSVSAVGAVTFSLNIALTAQTNSMGPSNVITACTSEPISYTVDVNPEPGVVTVDSASGTLYWGDGTETNITQPVETFEKLYSSNGSYTITVSVSWTGQGTNGAASGNGVQTQSVAVNSTCGPVITNQPANQQVSLGATAQFVVGASSAYPLTYQWYFDQTNALASGGTSSTLTLSNTTLNVAGSYFVVVANPYGSVTSAVATLTVVTSSSVPPSIVSQPTNQIVIAGSPASFQVGARGSVPLRYQWFFNQSSVLVGATNALLMVGDAQPAAAGGYSVVVINSAGAVTSSVALLTVLVPPTITQQPANVTTNQGANVVFSLTAAGTAPLAYQWQFNGNSLPGATNPALTLANVQTNQAGYYAVIVRNVAGSANSSNAFLTVSVPPSGRPIVAITSPTKDTSFCFGSDMLITASVSNALPVANVEFFAGDSLLGIVTSAPFQFNWPSPQVGNYDLTARVTDTAGNSAVSADIPVLVSAQCAPVAIIRPQADPEIDALQSYLLQMGLGSQVFDQAGLTANLLNGFELVIWDDLGQQTTGVTPSTVDVLSQIYAAGIPVYLIGEHLASSAALLPTAQQTEWMNLTLLSPGNGVGGDGTVQITNPEGPSNPVLFGQFGTIDVFPYPARVELATNVQADAEVFVTSAGACILAILPGLESPDQSPTRLCSQDVRVVPHDDLGATNMLRALFQNTVCWLTRCQSCLDTGLGLAGAQSNDVVQVGQVISFTLTASCSGECQPTGVVVTDRLPPAFGFAKASVQQGVWAYDSGSQQVTFFIGLMPQDGTVALSISAVALQAGTFTNTAGIRYNSTNALVVLDPSLVTTVLPNTNAVPPVLSLRVLSPSALELSLSGQSGLTYEIDSSADLLNWFLLTNITGPSWTGTLAPFSGTNSSAHFYRAKVNP